MEIFCWVYDFWTWKIFGRVCDFWSWKIFAGYEIFGYEIFFVDHEIFGHGKIFCWAWDFWSWENFLLGMRFLVMENFCWTWDFWSRKIFVEYEIFDHEKKNFGHVILEWKILVDMWFLIMLMMGQILFCKTSKAEVAFKCWKAYRKYYLRISGTSLMTRASRLSSKLYCTRKLMSTRISNYSLLCQNGFGIPRAHSIF